MDDQHTSPDAGTPAAGAGSPPAGSPPAPQAVGRPGGAAGVRGPTRLSAAWVGAATGTLLLIALVVFIAQNTGHVVVSFITFQGSFPLAVALLAAAAAGALLVLLLGAARIGQLRIRARRLQGSSASAPGVPPQPGAPAEPGPGTP